MSRKKMFSVVGICLSIALISIVAFIKLDTKDAAELTDNVLRPVLGPDTVLTMEKLFYNTSDRIQQLSHATNEPAPEFDTSADAQTVAGTRLNVTSIPIKYSFSTLPGEGVWKNRKLRLFPGQEVLAYTFVRPDPDRPYADVTLVQIDTHELRLGAVAGTKQPGGPVGMYGPGVVPDQIIKSGNLVAAFDGGFQYRDGEYGMIVGDTTYLPLQQDLGTLVGYKNGDVQIVNYTGQPLGKDVEFVRQNCPILIENGNIAILDERNKKLWGRTLTSGIFTWRSGIGITKEGNLLYAVGNNLTPLSLSIALQMGGAQNAIQLDINPYWVRFNIFDALTNGTYTTSTLVKSIQDGSKQYLHGYTKDFFYVYRRTA